MSNRKNDIDQPSGEPYRQRLDACEVAIGEFDTELIATEVTRQDSAKSVALFVETLRKFYENLRSTSLPLHQLARTCFDEWRAEEQRVTKTILNPFLVDSKAWIRNGVIGDWHLGQKVFDLNHQTEVVKSIADKAARAELSLKNSRVRLRRLEQEAEMLRDQTRATCTGLGAAG